MSKVVAYCTEEVSRQGHDVFALDGIERVGWMLCAWSYGLGIQELTLSTVESIGRRVERYRNSGGFRQVGVRVGSRICPPPREVIPRLELLLLESQAGMTPMEFYKEFELIHPFVDGNGRTGKILLNWKNGTLLEPIFPPADLFGEPIRNP